MAIFKFNNSKLETIKEIKIDLEKDIQKLTERNLDKVFGLKFVCGGSNKEFCVRVNEQDFYIDTVAFDESTNSVVLIEYKKDKSFSVIDQGFAYLAAMLNNKAEFVLEINERLGKNFTKKDIDWEQSRIIFISNEFTNYQKNAINFKDLPMYLYEVKVYDGLVDYNPIKPFRTSESINKFIKDKTVKDVTQEVKVYTVEDHQKKGNERSLELFDQLRSKIFELDDRIQEKAVSWYIGYKIRYQNFCTISIFRDKIRLYVRAASINDSKKLFKKVPNEYSWGKTPLWHIDISNNELLQYCLPILNQAYSDSPDK